MHVNVVLTVTADGFVLPTMVFVRGKFNLTIKDIVVLEGFVIVTQEKVWMGESLKLTWFEKYGKPMLKKIQDIFKAHKTDNVKVL